MPTPQSSQTPRKSNKLFSILCLLFLLVSCFIFFTSPLPNGVTPRWALLLEPTINSDFVNEIWFGIDLPSVPFSGERILALLIGVFFVVSSFLLGAVSLLLFRNLFPFNRMETAFFALGLGLILWSTFMFLAGVLGFGSISLLPLIIIISLVGIGTLTFLHHAHRSNKENNKQNLNIFEDLNVDKKNVINSNKWEKCIWAFQILLLTLFSSFYSFSATQPIFEYDAVEYHLQGAREIYESGQITFSNQNVYTNMPLGAEMFYLIGFDLAKDVGFKGQDVLRIGSLIGKTIITTFVYLTALGICIFCFRFLCNLQIGLWSSLLFLSFPGVFEVYVSGLNDCLLSFAVIAIFYILALRTVSKPLNSSNKSSTSSYACLLGIFTGFAIAVKYTSVVFILLPVIVAIVLVELKVKWLYHCIVNDKKIIKQTKNAPEQNNGSYNNDATSNINLRIILIVFFMTTFLIGGGWYFKNAITTGNPVYPLAYEIFGDSTQNWNQSINERWSRAHSSAEFGLHAFKEALSKTLWKDSLSSPFFIFLPILGVLTFYAKFYKKTIVIQENINRTTLFLLLILIICYWLGWYYFTHRLTRFLLPIAPFISIFIGAYIHNSLKNKQILSRSILITSLLTCFLYSGLLIDIFGQGRMAPLQALEQDPQRFSKESIYINNNQEELGFCNKLTDDSNLVETEQKLLLIGEARAFIYHVPLLYSTCWNDSPLIPILGNAVDRNQEGQITSINNPEQIRSSFIQNKVKYILVNYLELERFRSKGNYGYNNLEITKELFQLLIKANVIESVGNEFGLDKDSSTQVYKICSKNE